MKVAFETPFPPQRSGIADYSALIVPALRRHLEIDVFAQRPPRSYDAYDAVVYQIGNEPSAHGWILDELRRHSGLVVLHEFVLHHLVAGVTLGRGDRDGYARALEREAGLAGRLLAYGVIEGDLPPIWEVAPTAFPLAGEILDLAGGLIVHSRHMEERVREAGFRRPIWRVAHPAWEPPPGEPDTTLPPASFRIGAFGHLNPAKRVPQVLEAFVQVRERVPGAHLVLAGPPAPGLDLDALVAAHGLAGSGAVKQLGYVDEGRLWALLRACDVLAALRRPTMGETSGMAIRALAAGTPLVVDDVGWFSELPDAVAVKLGDEGGLADALVRLAEDETGRRAMSEASRAYIAEQHELHGVANEYASAIEESVGGDAVRNAFVAELSEAAAEVGIGVDDPELDRVSERVRELGL